VAFAIGTALAFAFLDPPWRWIAIGSLATVEALEIMVWLRLRRLRSMTGAEAMVGAKGRALTDCAPDGQVRVKGQIWRARCPDGAAAGDDMVVTRVDGLRLEVRRAAARPMDPGGRRAVPRAPGCEIRNECHTEGVGRPRRFAR
jgi:membrane protein implicated in regulation of membrane protease activity